MKRVNKLGIPSIADGNYAGKTVLLRLDLNCPVDPVTRKLRNTSRIDKNIPTLSYLLDQGAKVAILAHQGDSQNYTSLIPLAEHAERMSEILQRSIRYIDEVCGSAAVQAVKALRPGQAVLLGNLRYLAEEVTAFERSMRVEPEAYRYCWMVRTLAPLADAYVNDAFSVAHRNSPSMVAFQTMLPSAAGFHLYSEITALSTVFESPMQPAVYVLGGSSVSNTFGMMGAILDKGRAHSILTCGVIGLVMLVARGHKLGPKAEDFLWKHGVDSFVAEAAQFLKRYGDILKMPYDLGIADVGGREDVSIVDLPVEADLLDIGDMTISAYAKEILNAGTVFINGPPGMYEDPLFEKGTKSLFFALQETSAYTVIGGGDSAAAAGKYTDLSKIDHVCTAEGAMVHYLSGKKTPLITAMRNANGFDGTTRFEVRLTGS